MQSAEKNLISNCFQEFPLDLSGRGTHSSGSPLSRTNLPCHVCTKSFDRPSLLKRHMRTHTGEKPHVCDVCGKAFSTSSSLNTHRRIHSGEKPHQCPICGKRFTASSNLYYHRMTHTKEKPHKCLTCNKSFPTPGDLRAHGYTHTGSWPFRCPLCHRGFSKQTNLRNHLFLHTGDKPHECNICGKRFALACNLRAHAKTHGLTTNSTTINSQEISKTSAAEPFVQSYGRLENLYQKNLISWYDHHPDAYSIKPGLSVLDYHLLLLQLANIQAATSGQMSNK